MLCGYTVCGVQAYPSLLVDHVLPLYIAAVQGFDGADAVDMLPAVVATALLYMAAPARETASPLLRFLSAHRTATAVRQDPRLRAMALLALALVAVRSDGDDNAAVVETAAVRLEALHVRCCLVDYSHLDWCATICIVALVVLWQMLLSSGKVQPPASSAASSRNSSPRAVPSSAPLTYDDVAAVSALLVALRRSDDVDEVLEAAVSSIDADSKKQPSMHPVSLTALMTATAMMRGSGGVDTVFPADTLTVSTGMVAHGAVAAPVAVVVSTPVPPTPAAAPLSATSASSQRSTNGARATVPLIPRKKTPTATMTPSVSVVTDVSPVSGSTVLSSPAALSPGAASASVDRGPTIRPQPLTPSTRGFEGFFRALTPMHIHAPETGEGDSASLQLLSCDPYYKGVLSFLGDALFASHVLRGAPVHVCKTSYGSSVLSSVAQRHVEAFEARNNSKGLEMMDGWFFVPPATGVAQPASVFDVGSNNFVSTDTIMDEVDTKADGASSFVSRCECHSVQRDSSFFDPLFALYPWCCSCLHAL